jgi:hypothetical protein
MTISVTSSLIRYSGTGTTGPYTFPFRLNDDDDLRVIKSYDLYWTETYLVKDVGYTLSYVTGAEGGSVTLADVLPSGYTLTLARLTDTYQETDYVEGAPFEADVHENALDKIAMQVQDINERLRWAILLRPSGSLRDLTYEKPIPGYLLGWDALGTNLTQYPPASSVVIEMTGESLITLVAYAYLGETGVATNDRKHTNIFLTAEGPVSISVIGGTVLGALTTIIVGDDNITFVHGAGNITLKNGEDLPLTSGDMLTLLNVGGEEWREVERTLF